MVATQSIMEQVGLLILGLVAVAALAKLWRSPDRPVQPKTPAMSQIDDYVAEALAATGTRIATQPGVPLVVQAEPSQPIMVIVEPPDDAPPQNVLIPNELAITFLPRPAVIEPLARSRTPRGSVAPVEIDDEITNVMTWPTDDTTETDVVALH